MIIVVLGGGIDLQGNIPSYVYSRLGEAIKLSNNLDCKILVSGEYSFLYEKVKPPFTEAHKMEQYLLKKGIPQNKILKEELSKDTVGNAYYSKKYFFIPKKEKEAIVITSDFQAERVKYIFHKIFGPEYKLKIIGIKSELPGNEKEAVWQRQKELLLKTQALLSNMKDGDHNFLKDRIYKFKFYREKRPDWVKNFVAKGK
ncbi:MAG: hypothetical protein UU14_C0038G0004 [Candidatus Roizmanbacteria bacterium GW2011_GWB1_40_7]|uniref:DUF218 domain-containing protein n=1 Tax=Candidatus Roizmanbacteria bacterium GW2011_GWB1_40_7 TaxID=1618482 RepID=A0A0G0T1T0_9BACT|nr:MAG: hypothetical protein UU14_C0038G0004 [Candidatus Roizmanbacteria bacterium GW2011_GWB1_40_7]OGH51507.1 MAG: hypothetical protein A3H17_04575 [Candidatus Levybacteria bacterium RIFCSPLOWO2_12_FULL_37_14]